MKMNFSFDDKVSVNASACELVEATKQFIQLLGQEDLNENGAAGIELMSVIGRTMLSLAMFEDQEIDMFYTVDEFQQLIFDMHKKLPCDRGEFVKIIQRLKAFLDAQGGE